MCCSGAWQQNPESEAFAAPVPDFNALYGNLFKWSFSPSLNRHTLYARSVKHFELAGPHTNTSYFLSFSVLIDYNKVGKSSPVSLDSNFFIWLSVSPMKLEHPSTVSVRRPWKRCQTWIQTWGAQVIILFLQLPTQLSSLLYFISFVIKHPFLLYRHVPHWKVGTVKHVAISFHHTSICRVPAFILSHYSCKILHTFCIRNWWGLQAGQSRPAPVPFFLPQPCRIVC